MRDSRRRLEITMKIIRFRERWILWGVVVTVALRTLVVMLVMLIVELVWFR